MKDVDHNALREAFSAYMTGVTVVTAVNSQGLPIGFTANSFTSVSLDPPLLLVCLAKSSKNFREMTETKGFAVNVLAESQKHISNTFASPVEERFSAVAWAPGPYGSPVFANVSAWFDCSMHETVDAGDHTIMIGKVEAYRTGTVNGLGYARGAYFTQALEAAAAGKRADIIVSAIIRMRTRILLRGDGMGGLELPRKKALAADVSTVLEELLEDCGCSVSPGFIYSVYDDAQEGLHYISFLCNADENAINSPDFVTLNDQTLDRVSDFGVKQMLSRLQEESQIGHYGIYFGDLESGQVRQIVQTGEG